MQVGRRQLSANAPEHGAPWLGNAGASSEASRPRARSGLVAKEFPASVRWSYPSASLSLSSTTAEHNNNTTLRPDRQLQFQFVMSLGRFSSLFVCPATWFLNSPRTPSSCCWNAWYRSVFSLNSDASWHTVFCWRRTFSLSLEVLFQSVSPVRIQWIHDTSFLHREVSTSLAVRIAHRSCGQVTQ